MNIVLYYDKWSIVGFVLLSSIYLKVNFNCLTIIVNYKIAFIGTLEFLNTIKY